MIATFKVIVSGKMGLTFYPERDIRQDDPLSEYILNICAEYLGRYINFMENQAKSGIVIRLNKDDYKIPCLLFADNCIIFCRATKKVTRNARQILDHYCTVSGQFVNCHKSKIQFSTGVLNAEKKGM